MDPVTLMIAGTALQIVNGWASNKAKAEAEKQNAAYYREQALFAELSKLRANAIAEIDYTTKVGAQVSAYASGGVDLSGSASATVGGTIKNAIDELRVIQVKGNLETKLAQLRAGQSQQVADTIGSVGYNLLQATSTGINAYTRAKV